MALIDMAKPYIFVESMQFYEDEEQVLISFRVNGCVMIDEVNVYIDGVKQVLATGSDNHSCNQMLQNGQEQPIYRVLVDNYSDIQLEAVVDQHMGQSVNDDKVQPTQFVNDPQSHFAQIRLQDEYRVYHNGKYILASKKISLDLTAKVNEIFSQHDKPTTQEKGDDSSYHRWGGRVKEGHQQQEPNQSSQVLQEERQTMGSQSLAEPTDHGESQKTGTVFIPSQSAGAVQVQDVTLNSQSELVTKNQGQSQSDGLVQMRVVMILFSIFVLSLAAILCYKYYSQKRRPALERPVVVGQWQDSEGQEEIDESSVDTPTDNKNKL